MDYSRDDCFTGKLILPDDFLYEDARQEWNRAIQKYPAAIVYCHNTVEVRNAVLCARKHCLPIRIRSGGHNYEGYSVGNGVLVIDVGPMKRIELNTAENTVTVEAGVSNSELYDFVSSRGYPFPGGTCPTVHISGYTLGGGYGYSARHLGLGCDSLLEIEIVNYKGELITANAHCNQDLFWACRGAGGGNFGVAVSFKFCLPQKIDKLTLFELYRPNATQEIQSEFLDIWQHWLKNLDERITMFGSVYNSADEGKAVYGRGLFYGVPEEAEALLYPFLQIDGMRKDLEYLPFLTAIQKIESSYPDQEKSRSGYRFVYRDYDPREINRITGIVQEPRPDGSIFTSVNLYALGGAVSEVPNQATAYYYRDARYILGMQSIWLERKYQPVNVEWVDRRFRYIKSITYGSYVNFPYSPLMDYESEYFGRNRYRLCRVKQIYDPCNVFNFPQSIQAP